jgi:hypothetical protein
MGKKVTILAVLIALVGAIVYADLCTVTISAAKPFKTIVYSISIDYGQGKVESRKTESMTDFLSDMNSKGWKLEAYYSFGDGILQMVFQKQ